MLAHPQFIALHLVGRSVHLYLMDLTFRKILSKASFPWEGEGQRAGTQSARVTGRRWLWGTAIYVYCLVGFWVSGPPMAQARWQAQCVSGEVLSRVPAETFVFAPFKHWLSQHFNSEMELWNVCLALVWVTTLCVPWHIPAQKYFFFFHWPSSVWSWDLLKEMNFWQVSDIGLLWFKMHVPPHWRTVEMSAEQPRAPRMHCATCCR